MNNQLGVTNERLALTSGKPAVDMHYVSDNGYVKNKMSVKEMYYCWLSRFITFITVLSLMFFVSASLVLFKLVPEVHIEPFLIIRQSDSDNMVRYEAISSNMPSSRQMMELFIKQYVILRNTVIGDEREMQSRWFSGGMVHYLSSEKIFNEFSQNIKAKLNGIIKDRITKDVEIISLSKVGGEKSPVWKIDFKTYELSADNRNGSTGEMVLTTKYWTASIVAVFNPTRMFMSKRLMNPLGFTVTRYSQTEVEIL